MTALLLALLLSQSPEKTKVQQATSPWVTADTHTTAAAPLSCRLTDGAAFYTAGSGGGGGTSSSFGAAFPATGTAAGVKDSSGANLTFLKANASNALVVDGSAVTQPVSGSVSVSNFPASQAVTGTFWQTTQPVSGPLTDTQLRASAVPVSGTFWQVTQPVSGSVSVSNFPASQAVTGTFWQVTQPVSGTVTSNQGGTWTVQPGNTANSTAWLVTGTGGTFPATQSGTWTDRVVGSAGGAFDAANNAAAPANVIAQGDETITQGSQPTAATTGNVRRVVAGLDGVQYARLGGPANWSCFVPISATATTQCLAAPAAGLRAYVVSLNCSNGAATVQGVDVVYGTGAACVTGTTALTHKYQMGTNATTTSPYQVDQHYGTGLVPAAANAICLRPTAATAFGCTLTGYTAP